MSLLSRLSVLVTAILLNIAAFGTVSAADPLVFTYHGWKIDLTGARGADQPDRMVAAVKRQLDIVEQVKLKPDVLTFMRSIPIWAEPKNAAAGPGRYAPKTGVDLRVKLLDPDKPIILHEFLHAYHYQLLPQSVRNPDVLDFFNRGKQYWPADAYMMTNPNEFFAVTASVYLFGSIDRPPFSRAELKSKQPNYYQWLARLFDDGKER